MVLVQQKSQPENWFALQPLQPQLGGSGSACLLSLCPRFCSSGPWCGTHVTRRLRVRVQEGARATLPLLDPTVVHGRVGCARCRRAGTSACRVTVRPRPCGSSRGVPLGLCWTTAGCRCRHVGIQHWVFVKGRVRGRWRERLWQVRSGDVRPVEDIRTPAGHGIVDLVRPVQQAFPGEHNTREGELRTRCATARHRTHELDGM